MKKAIALILSIILVMAITLPAAALSTIAVKSIKLNSNNVSLKVGQTYILRATLTPANTTQKLLTYVVGNKKIATIDKIGRITGVSAGKTTITVYTPDKKVFAKSNVTISRFDKKATVITMTLQDNASFPMNKNGEIFKIIESNCNVKLDITIIPEANFLEKSKIMMATGEFSDVMYSNTTLSTVLKYANDGLIMPLDELIVKYGPNIKRFFPPEQKIKIQNSDRHMYNLPTVYTDNLYYLGWMAREDIMKAVGITKVPETIDEFYSMLKAMKAKYPDSYPVALRQPTMMAFMCSWGLDEGTWGLSFRNGQFVFGGTGNEDKACMQFVNKLYTEKLLDPEFATCSTAQWEDKITNNKSFVTWDYMVRSEYFGNAVSKINPKFNLKIIPLPKADKNITPNTWVPDKIYAESSFVINKTTKVAVEAIKMFDYLYSDAGIELINWGIEGKTFAKVDGRNTFLPNVKTALNPKGTLDVQKDYSVQVFYPVLTPDAYAAISYGKNSIPGSKMYQEKNFGRPVAPIVDAFITKENNDKAAAIATPLYPIRDQNVIKFITGKRPFSEWDKYIEELKSYKMDDLTKIYNDAYAAYLNR